MPFRETTLRGSQGGPEEFHSNQEDSNRDKDSSKNLGQQKEYKEMQIIKLKRYQNVDVEDVKIALDLYLHGKNRQQMLNSINSGSRSPGP